MIMINSFQDTGATNREGRSGEVALKASVALRSLMWLSQTELYSGYIVLTQQVSSPINKW